MKHLLLPFLAALVVIFLSATSTDSINFVSAASNGLSSDSFSLYSYLGGLWNVYYVDSLTTTAESTTKSFVSKVATAFSPDFVGTCQIEGRAQFPDASSVIGLPEDIDLGGGSSEVVACSATLFSGTNAAKIARVPEREIIARSSASVKETDTYLIVVPTSMTRATVYRATHASVFSAKFRKVFTDDKKKKKTNSASTASAEEEQGPAGPFLVTHKADLRVNHQGSASLLSVASLTDLKAASSTSSSSSKKSDATNRPSLDVAQASGMFVPMSSAIARALKDEAELNSKHPQEEEDKVCNVDLTRFSAVLTTTDDALVTVGVRYSQCLPAAAAAAAAAVPPKKKQEEGEQTDDQKNETVAPAAAIEADNEQLLLFNVKRFASIHDDEATLKPDAAWYEKKRYGPTIGAFVLLAVIIGGKRGIKWFLKKKGIDVDKFMKSTKPKNASELEKWRAERLKNKTGPTTDEEVSKLQEEEAREFVRKMKEEGNK